MKQTIAQFWEQQHRREHKSHLSGCGYQETIDFLQLEQYIHQDVKVLEVGVGLGYVTQGLYNQRAQVQALDISEIALNRVKAFCVKVYTIPEIQKLPPNFFDLIICHNVSQHISTPLLKEELKYLIQSLTPQGIFALEFVSMGPKKDTWDPYYRHQGRLPSFGRSISFMQKLVQGAGGKSTVAISNEIQNKKVTGCHVLHIQRN